MSADLKRLLSSLSREDLQRLLNAKDEIEGLEQRRQALLEELAVVEKDLARLVATTAGKQRRSKSTSKAGGKKKAAKKTVARKAAKKKSTAKKAATKKTASKKAAAKKAGTRKAGVKKTTTKKTGTKKTGTRKTAPRTATAGQGAKRQTLEDVVMGILREHGQPMPFQVLLETIVTGGHFKSRSKNFDNVLRRTLSTSERIKRLSRGVYGL